jgi:hypothetical protein
MIQSDEQLIQVLDAVEAASRNAMALAREYVQSRGDNDEWTRFPPQGKRCGITQMSRSSIQRLCDEKTIRDKKVGGARYYSAKDIKQYYFG